MSSLLNCYLKRYYDNSNPKQGYEPFCNILSKVLQHWSTAPFISIVLINLLALIYGFFLLLNPILISF